MDVVAKQNPLSDWDNLPLSHARILYDNKLNATTTAAAEPALTPNTWERWTDAGGTDSVRFQTSSATTVDAIGIGAHNLGTAGTEIQVETATTLGGPWTEQGYATPTDNEPLLFLFDPVEDVVDVRISITGGSDREIGVIYAGRALQMYQPIYGGHGPIDLSASTEYQSNMSESGQFLGRNIVRKGTEANYSFKNLDPEWVREKLKPFIDSARTAPFFIKWRPDRYDDIALCYTTDDIRPTNMGGGSGLMQVNFSVKGHSDI